MNGTEWAPLMLGKMGIILAAGTWAGILSADPSKSVIVTVLAMGGLILYRLKRKFKRERAKGILDFMDRNWVEIILGAAIVPGAVSTVLEMVKEFL